MNLIDYYPTFLKEVREFKEICRVVGEELELLNNRIKNMLREVYISTAESYGLDRYEKIYGIENNTTNIEIRRFNISSKKNNKIPFTKNWLINKLNNTVGIDNYKLNISYDEHTLKIEIVSLFKDIASLLYTDLRILIPANLELNIELFRTEETILYTGAIMHIGKIVTIGGGDII